MTEKFNPGTFVVRAEAPQFLSPTDSREVAVKLKEKLGGSWRPTPTKAGQSTRCWWIGADGLQFTIVAYGERWDIAFYEYPTVTEFKAAFEEKSHVSNAIYFQTKSEDFYTGNAILRFLKETGRMALLE